MKPTQYGYLFENVIKKSFALLKSNGLKIFFFKIPDARTMKGKGKIKAYGTKVPADFFAIFSKTPFLFECKSTSRNRFMMSMVKPHQLEALVSIWGYGAEGYFFIEHRIPRKHVMYIVDANYFWENPKSSYSWDEIKKVCVFHKAKKYDMYDLSEWVNEYGEKERA